MENIIAYHHTNKGAAQLILKHCFDSRFFKMVSIGYGVQCFLDKLDRPKLEGKTDGQIEVEFIKCILLEDDRLIEESQERIQQATGKEMLEVAKIEAETLKSQGFDAYKGPAFASKKEYIVFLNFPQVIDWIPFDVGEQYC